MKKSCLPVGKLEEPSPGKLLNSLPTAIRKKLKLKFSIYERSLGKQNLLVCCLSSSSFSARSPRREPGPFSSQPHLPPVYTPRCRTLLAPTPELNPFGPISVSHEGLFPPAPGVCMPKKAISPSLTSQALPIQTL